MCVCPKNSLVRTWRAVALLFPSFCAAAVRFVRKLSFTPLNQGLKISQNLISASISPECNALHTDTLPGYDPARKTTHSKTQNMGVGMAKRDAAAVVTTRTQTLVPWFSSVIYYDFPRARTSFWGARRRRCKVHLSSGHFHRIPLDRASDHGCVCNSIHQLPKDRGRSKAATLQTTLHHNKALIYVEPQMIAMRWEGQGAHGDDPTSLGDR